MKIAACCSITAFRLPRLGGQVRVAQRRLAELERMGGRPAMIAVQQSLSLPMNITAPVPNLRDWGHARLIQEILHFNFTNEN
jgi:hypothetical protein